MRIISSVLVCQLLLPVMAFSGSSTPLSKKRLDGGINSFQPVVMPVLSYDSQRLYFSRKYHPQNVGASRDPDDIWYCERNGDSLWSEAVNAGAPLNTAESNVLCSISADGTTALIETTVARGAQRVHSFALSSYTDNAWQQPRPIVIRNFSNESKYFYAQLAFDDSTLLLAIQDQHSLGNLDLYVAFREGRSPNFSEPKNLGPTINTTGTEGSPCLGFDGSTLYFSSDGHGGFGNQDLFVCHRLDAGWTAWSTPENLGPGINTPGLDHCFTLSPTGDTAYIVSGDSASGTGIYQIVLPPAQRISRNLVDSARKVAQSTTLSFELYFQTDSFVVDTTELRNKLRPISTLLRKQAIVITVDGYADDHGSVQHNQVLSLQRALHVEKALRLIWKLNNTQFIRHHAYGSTTPRFDNQTNEGRQKNRCVVVSISPMTRQKR